MKNLALIIVILASVLYSNKVSAAPYMGGEIYWKCIPVGQNDAGKFVFYLRLYRDCNSIPYGTTQTLSSTTPVGNIYLSLVTAYPKDITKVCNEAAFSGVGFIDCNGGTNNTNGAVTEYLYKSSPVMLNSVPPASGWTFSHSSCCRNYANNLSNQNYNYFLRAKMYPYNNNNVYPCFDNSPEFVETAQPIISGGYPAKLNYSAYDNELDSLIFEWGAPMQDNNSPIVFAPSYSYASPLPGAAQDTNNSAAVIDPYSGIIFYESHTEGYYLMSVKLYSYKCGQLVAENWREILVKIKNQINNSPPVIDVSLNTNNTLIDTVHPGDTVSFPVNVVDYQFLPNGSMQEVEFNAFSNMFGDYIPASGSNPATYSETTGCLNPPCATLTPAPSPTTGITGNLSTQVQFNWVVGCNHFNSIAGCGVTTNKYNFYYKANDDYCPLPADNLVKHTIVVLPKPYNYSTKIECINKLQNGDIEIKWNPINDTTGRFEYYVVSGFNSILGYTIIDTTSNMNENTKIIDVDSFQGEFTSFYIEIKVMGIPYNISNGLAKPIELNSIVYDPCRVNLHWNSYTSAVDSVFYKIYRKANNSQWLLVDSTTSLTYFAESNNDIDYLYKVESADVVIYDSLGNYTIDNSRSNIIEAPKIMSIGSDTTICINNTITLYSNNFLGSIYLWSNGSIDSYVDINAADLGVGTHQIWLAATNLSGCYSTDTMVLTVDACASVEDVSKELDFNILPNPSDGEFIVKLNYIKESDCSYEILDMKGLVVLKNTISEKEFKVDLSDQAAGNYLIRINMGDRIAQRMLIIR